MQDNQQPDLLDFLLLELVLSQTRPIWPVKKLIKKRPTTCTLAVMLVNCLWCSLFHSHLSKLLVNIEAPKYFLLREAPNFRPKQLSETFYSMR